MATRKTSNLLPVIFQTDTNQKFLSATVDQLVTEPNLKKINGYIGRKFAPTYQTQDSYVVENTFGRQNYQLEPSVVIRNEQKEITFFASYVDFLNKLKYYGAEILEQSRLFDNEYYSYDPLISFDKIVNFSQYYWLPNGPQAVDVFSGEAELLKTYTVTRNPASGNYTFSADGVTNNTLTLARGGEYKFIVNQPGNPFWIQAELGVDGKINATPTINSRGVLGVINNGADVGTVTFRVPQSFAQDAFLQLTRAYTVDFTTTLPYSKIQNQLVSQLQLDPNVWDGQNISDLNGKTFVFIEQDKLVAYDDVQTIDDFWTVKGDYQTTGWDANPWAFNTDTSDNDTGNPRLDATPSKPWDYSGFGPGTTVPESDRVSVWTVTLVPARNTLELSFPITVNVGDVIAQPVSGAAAQVIEATTNSRIIKIKYLNDNTFATYLGGPTTPGDTRLIRINDVPQYTDTGVIFYGVYPVEGTVNDFIVRLDNRDGTGSVRNIDNTQKVFVKNGVNNANKEYYKTTSNLLKEIPLITSNLDELYYQDGTTTRIYGRLKIVEANNFVIDVEKDIIGQAFYTSPNGVEFTSGLKVRFDVNVTPAKYQNKEYYVENVGDSIVLVDPELLIRPETYNVENDRNYPVRKIVLSKATTAIIPAGTSFAVGSSLVITTNTETPLGSSYLTTLDSTEGWTLGLPVTGDGIASGTSLIDVIPEQVFPEYVTIVRASQDLNPWVRNNRWFHREVISKTAEYLGIPAIYDQTLRAQRPIIQFETNIQLVNSGRIGKRHIDALDLLVKDAFNELQGKELTIAFGINLFNGMRVVFAGDNDPFVRNKIYNINLIYPHVDEFGTPIGNAQVNLTVAEDGENEIYDTVVVAGGKYKGSQWWFNGDTWLESQQKTSLQQAPLFDVFDRNGRSLTERTRSSFVGTNIFSYKQGTGTNDSVLGFPLSYRNFTTQGDIEFVNNFDADVYSYAEGSAILENQPINQHFLYKFTDRLNVKPRNVWTRAIESSKQYQIISSIYNGFNNPLVVDIEPVDPNAIPTTQVYINNVYQTSSNYTFVTRNKINLSKPLLTDAVVGLTFTIGNNRIVLSETAVAGQKFIITNNSIAGVFDETLVQAASVPEGTLVVNSVVESRPELLINVPLTVGDKIDVLLFSRTVSNIGRYEVPKNLDFNAENKNMPTVTLGQFRNHVVESGKNSLDLTGDLLGVSNLRDVELKDRGGNILQHSAPVTYGMMFMVDEQANLVNAIRYAAQEYTKFKNKFIELSMTLQGIDPTDAPASVDLILANINAIKNITFPWYYSDMVPYGELKSEIIYTVFDPLQRIYEISEVFADKTLSNKAVLVYHNGMQLVKDLDFVFMTDRPAIQFTNAELAIDDTIKIVEYSNTDANYIPETPTKLGLYPKFIPEIFLDDTYRSAINVIRGHDGSITPCFGDYRDEFLLELEKRIFNNIKLADTGTYREIFAVNPQKFRDNQYTYPEATRILGKGFLTWIGNNKLDYSKNADFLANDMFTWNYANFQDRINGEPLQGSWRACYLYFYGTTRPHLHPWEMLGFTIKPDWWETWYGPAPYSGGNKLLWDDLERGRIRGGPQVGTNPRFAKPGLSKIIPVDENGFLKPPAQVLVKTVNSRRANSAWAVGQYGPMEWAWRQSSEFPFYANYALALVKPAKFFGLLHDVSKYNNTNALGQYLNTATNQHVRKEDLTFNGYTENGRVTRTAGYINLIADYLTNLGISPTSKLLPMLRNYEVNLAYKMAGFTDKKYITVLAEQSSPGSTNSSVILPDENYAIHLYKSTPVQKITYSAVIVEKSTAGYTVRGYDLINPFFTIIPSVVSANNTKLTVLEDEAVVYFDYKSSKVTVPYGYEFTTKQQLADFLISYERFLVSQGFTFEEHDELMAETRDWKLAVKEFLFWSQQGWKAGSVLVLSPVGSNLNAISVLSIVDEITDSQHGSKALDLNFTVIKRNNYTVLRSPNAFKFSTLNGDAIGLLTLNLVQYEHVLVFDNTTVFNDIVYKPETGNRQFRLKLIGQKTADWDGSLSAPGFVYNSGTVDAWMQGKDYLKGDLVEFKNQYYVALQNIVASNDFQFAFWKLITVDELKKGLLPNFSSIAYRFNTHYDSYSRFDDNDQIQYGHGLIGYKPRQYLADLGLTDTTQIEFYKGFIKTKGSLNSISELTTAQFNNLSSNIDLYEEWALRVGEYGALGINPYLEIRLDEKQFSVNPATAEFVGQDRNNEGDGINIFNKSQLYKSTEEYTGNIALIRDDSSEYGQDIPTAGYVNIDDVDATIFDIQDYQSLNSRISEIGSGYTIWVAKDFEQRWNVYRVTETDNTIIRVTNSLDGFITFTSDFPHGLTVNDVFLVRGFNDQFDGFYQVYKIVDLENVMVKYSGNTSELTTIEEEGVIYKLDSLRFLYMEDARLYVPPNGWKEGEKIWIDVDAPTSFVQGQPFETGNNLWKVYEKKIPWKVKQSLDKTTDEYYANDGFGTSVRISYDGLYTVVGSPNSNNVDVVLTTAFTGNLISANVGDYITQTTSGANLLVLSSVSNTNKITGVYVAGSVPFVTGSGNISINGVSSIFYPDSVIARRGKVNTFARNFNGDFIEGTVLTADGGNAYSYGASVDVSRRGVAVGAPDSDNHRGLVYIYDQSNDVSQFTRAQIIHGNLTVAGNNDKFGAAISFDELGNWLYVGAPGNDRVYVFGRANFVNEQSYSQQVLTGSNTLTFDFVPDQDCLNDANSFLVTTNTKTYVPDIDYTVSGNVITFVSPMTSNVEVNVYQRPYYTLVTTLQGVADSDFGIALDSSWDGAQLGVGVPKEDVVDYDGNFVPRAGAVYVYDRIIEAFTTTGNTTYTPTGTINPLVHRVLIEDQEVDRSDYEISLDGLSIIFNQAPELGKVVYIETNDFNLLELLIGTVVQEGAAFGTSLTICSNNCAIYVGAPYYDNGTTYNTGAVFKFHNRGRLYGTNTGDVPNPTFLVADTVRLDNFEIPVTSPIIYANIVSAGTNYSQGITVTVSDPDVSYGVTATANVSVNVATKTIETITVTNPGFGYTANPSVTINKPANVNAIMTAGTASENVVVDDSELIKVGMFVLGTEPVTANVFVSNQFVTEIVSPTLVKLNAASDTTMPAGNIRFFDKGASGSITATINTSVDLDSLIEDINRANVLGVTAVKEFSHSNPTQAFLRLNSDKKVAKNLLRILSGTNNNVDPTNTLGVSNVFNSAGMRVFAEMQIIINPFNTPGEYFGNKVLLAANAYMLVISSERGTTRNYTTFEYYSDAKFPDSEPYVVVNGAQMVNTNQYVLDPNGPRNENPTTFDSDTTVFFDSIKGSGSVYIYELYDDPRDNVEHPGRYAYAQQLNPLNLNTNDKFGTAIDIVDTYIVASAPGDDTTVLDAGTVYLFENPTLQRGWELIRYQEDTVDIESVTRIYLYNNISNTILTNLEFIDPAKGKILGIADQEITYKTEFDPASYNRGVDTDIHENISPFFYWNETQVGDVWWDLSRLRFIDYEQGSLQYRSNNWGRLFPDSDVTICEWVESDVLPSEYVDNGGDGEPRYPNDEHYVEITYVDQITTTIRSKYYYWVVNKTVVDTNLKTRSLPVAAIKDAIENPKSQGISYAAIIKNNAIIVYNVGQYLSADNTILHLDYEIIKNSNIIHSEYELVQKGNPTIGLPDKVVVKIIDSMAGIDAQGEVVPDPKLSPADRYGISYRPRQSVVVNRLEMIKNFITYINGVLITLPAAYRSDLTALSVEDPKPVSKAINPITGVYDIELATETELDYIDTEFLATGYKVLVSNDTTQDGLWVVYELQADKSWRIFKVQAYKTSQSWRYVDWYADGYSVSDQITYNVADLVEAYKLPYAEGDLIKINNIGGSGNWQLVQVQADGSFETVALQNGTIQLNDELANYEDNELGFGNQTFEGGRFDQNPNKEMRNILFGLPQDIFTGELQKFFASAFFVVIDYIFSEQKSIDWMFKTSFISVSHKLRSLLQYPSYIRDNQEYFERYISEVKPYSSKIREYLIRYDGTDTFDGGYTDFDLPPYYDRETGVFRSPTGEGDSREVAKDQQIWATGFYENTLINPTYPLWYEARTLKVEQILIADPGEGYTSEPLVVITGGGSGASGATARAVIDFDTGTVTDIIVTNPGTGYIQNPTVTINGSATRDARAYAVIKNNQVRGISTVMKFDRITFNPTVKDWVAGTTYKQGELVAIETLDGTGTTRTTYRVNEDLSSDKTAVFNTDFYTIVGSGNLATATDRIVGYYNPLETMPVVEEILANIEITRDATNSTRLYVNDVKNIVANVGMFISGLGVNSAVITDAVYDVMLLSGNVNVEPGDTITQSSSLATATVLTKGIDTNVIKIDRTSVDQFIYGSGTLTLDNGETHALTVYPVEMVNYVDVSEPQTLTTGTTITAKRNYVGQLIKGIEYPGVQVTGTGFNTQPGLDSTSDRSFSPKHGIQTLSLTEREIYYNHKQSVLTFGSGAFTYDIANNASVGSHVTQTGSNANARIISLSTSDAVIEYVNSINPDYLEGNIFTINGGNLSVDGAQLVNINDPGGANIGVYPKAEKWLNADFAYEIPNNLWWDTTANVMYKYVGGAPYDNTKWQPQSISNAGTPFDEGLYDGVEYDEDGNPVLSQEAIDTIIRSSYTDQNLGLRPEDIVVDGGEYVDTYASHAPEEFVPGMTFDTLNMQVFTKLSNASVTGDTIVGYRIFKNMLNETRFLRISYQYATILTQDLAIDDDVIYVSNASALAEPNKGAAVPGAVFIGDEKIYYWTRNTTNNTLSQIRRGTEGTGAKLLYPAGTTVVDGSNDQFIPNTEFGEFKLWSANVYTPTMTTQVPYNLKLSSNVTLDVGNVIVQTTTGIVANVIGISRSGLANIDQDQSNVVTISGYVPLTTEFDWTNYVLRISAARTVLIGDVITQPSTGTNLVVMADSGNVNVSVKYTNLENLTFGSGNLYINGVDAGIYPINQVLDADTLMANIGVYDNYADAIDPNVAPTFTGIYPVSAELAGKVNDFGQYNLEAPAGNLVLTTSEVWYAQSVGNAADGTGFIETTTPQILHLKEAASSVNYGINLENWQDGPLASVNTLSTENGTILIEE